MTDTNSQEFDQTHQQQRKSSGLPWVLLLLTVAAAAAAGYLGWGLYQTKSQALADALKSSDESAGQLKQLQDQVNALETEKGSIVAERDTLASDLKAKEEELAKLKATYDSINTQLQSEIEKGEVQLTQTGERIQVDLVDKILFPSGEADLTERGKEVLARLGGVIATVENKVIQVSGHTDDSPIKEKLATNFPTNWELSVSRAVNVVRHLNETAKVPAKRLVAAGYGQWRPIATNATHEGRARNRRIEIVLTPDMDMKKADLPKSVAAAPTAKPVPAKATTKAATAPTAAKKSTKR
jgi:chemotaxis protein MotB